jgi:hypothetical protein
VQRAPQGVVSSATVAVMWCNAPSSSISDEIPLGQLIGYARVSTASQDLAFQRDAAAHWSAALDDGEH